MAPVGSQKENAMGDELFLCQECEDHNRHPFVALDRHLRCEQCGSDAVESVQRIESLRGSHPVASSRQEA